MPTDLTKVILLFFCTLSLLFTAYQDFKDRLVYVVLFPVSFLLCGVFSFVELSVSVFLKHFLINLGLILLNFLLLTLYFSIKNKKIISIINQQFGLGDLLFLFVLAAVFSPFDFVLFLIISSFASLIFVLTVKAFKNKTVSVPFAGIQSVLLCFLYLHAFFLKTEIAFFGTNLIFPYGIN